MKNAAAYLVLGIILGGSVYPIMTEAQTYYGKFPPTPAWQELEADNNFTRPLQEQLFLNATSYSDKMFIVSDGSISVTFVPYP